MTLLSEDGICSVSSPHSPWGVLLFHIGKRNRDLSLLRNHPLPTQSRNFFHITNGEWAGARGRISASLRLLNNSGLQELPPFPPLLVGGRSYALSVRVLFSAFH
jgi:hypothetical protein